MRPRAVTASGAAASDSRMASSVIGPAVTRPGIDTSRLPAPLSVRPRIVEYRSPRSNGIRVGPPGSRRSRTESLSDEASTSAADDASAAIWRSTASPS